MNGDRILDTACISSGIGDHDRNVTGSSSPQDQIVALFEPFNGQGQPSELIFSLGIRTGDIAENLRLELPERRTECLIQPSEILLIVGSIRQVNIDRGGRFFRRIVIRLMQRNGEDLQLSSAAIAQLGLNAAQRSWTGAG